MVTYTGDLLDKLRKQDLIPIPANIQRRINVVSTLWINVEITLIRSWKWNKIRRRIFNVAWSWYNVTARRWKNVKTMLHNVKATLPNVGTTLFQPSVDAIAILNPVGKVTIMDLQRDE